MSINFFELQCVQVSWNKLFGLCDDQPPPNKPAYINENDGKKWIAVVNNERKLEVKFVAIDNCISIKKSNGKPENRCDGLLTYDSTVIFIELKQRTDNKWMQEGDRQLRKTIIHFEKTDESQTFNVKKAYIANSKNPKFKTSQIQRMDKFFQDTGYVLRIENRIVIE